MTGAQLVDAVLRFYVQLIGEREASLLKGEQTRTGDRLRKLEELQASNLAALHPLQSDWFLRTYLDCFGMCAATGAREEQLRRLEPADPKLLEKKQDLLRRLRDPADQHEDWLFSVYVRGWGNLRGFGEMRDLRRVGQFRQEKARPADFLVGLGGRQEIIECSRIHPRSEDSPVTWSALADKTWDRVKDKASQISDSRAVLRIPDASGHIILDISAYAAVIESRMIQSESTGPIGFASDEIERLAGTLRELGSDAPPEGIDVVSLCWSNSYVAENAPTAITHYARQINLTSLRPVFNYTGLTLEGYFSERYAAHQMAISSAARSHAWLKARHYSLTDQLLTWGKVETYDDYVRKQKGKDP